MYPFCGTLWSLALLSFGSSVLIYEKSTSISWLLLLDDTHVYFSTALLLLVSNMVGLTAITNQVPMNRVVSHESTTSNGGSDVDGEFPMFSNNINRIASGFVGLVNESAILARCSWFRGTKATSAVRSQSCLCHFSISSLNPRKSANSSVRIDKLSFSIHGLRSGYPPIALGGGSPRCRCHLSKRKHRNQTVKRQPGITRRQTMRKRQHPKHRTTNTIVINPYSITLYKSMAFIVLAVNLLRWQDRWRSQL
jgi:hypothetical protein